MNEPVTKSIGITYTENGEHFLEAAAQVKTTGLPVWAYRYLIILVVPLAVLAHLIPDIREGNQRNVLIDVLVGIVILVFFWMVGIFPTRKTELRRYQRAYRQTTGRDEAQATCEFSETGVLVMGASGVATHLPWSSIDRVIERPLGLVFYTGPKVFHWFPKRAFVAPSHYDELIALIQSKVSKFERTNVKS